MIQEFINNYSIYIFIVFLLMLLGLIFLLVQSNKRKKKMAALDRRIEILENFEKVLSRFPLTSSDEYYEDEDVVVENEYVLDENESYGRTRTDKIYKGDTKLDRIMAEYKDVVVHKNTD